MKTYRLIAIVLVGALLFVVGHLRAVDKPSGYTPVAPATAMHVALQTNLNIVRDWLEQRDLLSAIETVQGMGILARLYGYQNGQPEWRERTTALRAACDKFVAAARRKDAAACEKLAQECGRLLDDLARTPLRGDPVVDKLFKPFGSLKAWMLLMEGAHVDARDLKSTKEIQPYAYAIAEEANVVAYLRPDPRWRKLSDEVRDAALTLARNAPQSDLATARQALKNLYVRCESCHHNYQR